MRKRKLGSMLAMAAMSILVIAGGNKLDVDANVTEQKFAVTDGVLTIEQKDPSITELKFEGPDKYWNETWSETVTKIVIKGNYTSLITYDLASDYEESKGETHRLFGNYQNLTEVVLPESLTSITGVFINCPKLTKINLENVEELSYSFRNCPSLKNVDLTKARDVDGSFYESGLETVIMPNVERLSSSFSNCVSLKSVQMSGEIEEVLTSFKGCTALTVINLPKVEKISYSFDDCTALTSVTLPGVNKIEDSFNNCTNLTSANLPEIETITDSFTGTPCFNVQSGMAVVNGRLFVLDKNALTGVVTIPEGVTEINDNVFGYNDTITKIIFPSTLNTISDFGIFNCPSLVEVEFPKEFDISNSDLNSAFLDTPWLTNQEFVIVNSVLVRCNSKEAEITIPAGVTKIGNNAFNNSNCNQTMESVIIPEGVVEIEKMAFASCGRLWKVKLPKTLTTIGDRAFAGHEGNSIYKMMMSSVEIPASVTKIGYEAFGYSIRKAEQDGIPMPGFTVKGVAGSAAEKYAKENNFKFEAIDKIDDSNGNNNETPSTEKPSDTTGTTPAKGTKVTVSNATYKVTKAGSKDAAVEYVAPKNTSAATITIPETVKVNDVTCKVTSIAANAFKGNKKIKKVTIGSNVTSIGVNAFSGCTKLTTVTIGKNVKTIGKKAFYNCTAIKKITIPAKVTKIGAQAFQGAKKLSNIVIKTTKLTKVKVGKNAFKGVKANATVKVPKAKKKAYKTILKARGITKVKMK